MSVEISKKSFGNITFLYLDGKLTLGEGSVTFREVIKELAARGLNKVVLDMAKLKYFDSSGLGELVSAFTTLTRSGGSLGMMRLTTNKRISDALQITKLYSVFEVFDDETSACSYLAASPLHGQCPICGHRSVPALIDDSGWQPQTCTKTSCGTRFVICAEPGMESDRIDSARIETYPGEYCEVATGKPHTIVISGRLNLFTSSALLKLHSALPQKIVLFDLRLVTEITPEGRDALLRIASQPTEQEGAVISLEGLAPDQTQIFLNTGTVYPDHASALLALGGLVEQSRPWPGRFEQPK